MLKLMISLVENFNVFYLARLSKKYVKFDFIIILLYIFFYQPGTVSVELDRVIYTGNYVLSTVNEKERMCESLKANRMFIRVLIFTIKLIFLPFCIWKQVINHFNKALSHVETQERYHETISKYFLDVVIIFSQRCWVD